MSSNEENPEFLKQLDSDPESAFSAFYRSVVCQLNLLPPQPMRGLSEDEHTDLVHDIVFHCVRNDFRVLRKYRPTGHPFSAWFYIVAHRVAMDYRRKQKHIHHVSLEEGNEPTTVASPELIPVVELVRVTIQELAPFCRTLLYLAADECAPREMVRVLAMPDGDNKKVSDRLRECRNQLRRRLADAGVDIARCLANSGAA